MSMPQEEEALRQVLSRLERDLSELREFSSIEQSCFEQQGRVLAAALEAERVEGQRRREEVERAEERRSVLEEQVRALEEEREQRMGQLQEMQRQLEVRETPEFDVMID